MKDEGMQNENCRLQIAKWRTLAPQEHPAGPARFSILQFSLCTLQSAFFILQFAFPDLFFRLSVTSVSPW
jgi:hypothetical protein